MNIKRCNQCKLDKLITDFSKDNSKKDKLQNKCKVCIKEIVKKHTKENKYKFQKLWNDKKRSEGYYTKYAKSGYWNNYQKNRRKKDPYYSLYINIRSRISNLISGKNKSKSTQQIIGMSTNDFKLYIESKWVENMNWDNYGYGPERWVLDHKIPISSAQNLNEIIELNHYSNLQPMWWRDNLIKRDK
jgi:hypothetical protein